MGAFQAFNLPATNFQLALELSLPGEVVGKPLLDLPLIPLEMLLPLSFTL